jgi:hypothetical protein
MAGQNLVELDVPNIVNEPHAVKPRNFFKPSDILVMRHGGLFHMPVIYDHELHFVNAVISNSLNGGPAGHGRTIK